MRISDWSSDVCSSDLAGELVSGGERGAGAGADRGRDIKRLARGADYAFDARMSRSRIFPWRYGMFLALLASMAPLGLLLPWHEAVMAGFDVAALAFILSAWPLLASDAEAMRSEERPVGTEGVMQCKSRR